MPELLEVLDFRPLPAPYLRPEVTEPGVSVFRPDVPDFVLTVVAPDAAARGVDLAIPGGGPAIAFVASGAVTLDGFDASFTLERGGRGVHLGRRGGSRLRRRAALPGDDRVTGTVT